MSMKREKAPPRSHLSLRWITGRGCEQRREEEESSSECCSNQFDCQAWALGGERESVCEVRLLAGLVEVQKSIHIRRRW